MKKKCIVAVLIWLFTSLSASLTAQVPEYKYKTDSDVQFRTGFELEKKISRHFSVSWNEELRLKDNFTQLDRIYSDISFSGKATKWLKFSVGYTFISVYHDGNRKTDYKSYWDLRHRVYFGPVFSYKTDSNWEFSLKEKFQVTFYNYDDINQLEVSDPAWALKSKFSVSYKVRPVPLIPYASVEVCNTLNAPKLLNGEYVDKVRSALGLKYRFDKHNSLNFFYRFDYNLDKKLDVKNSTGVLKSITFKKDFNHIFCVSYTYKF